MSRVMDAGGVGGLREEEDRVLGLRERKKNRLHQQIIETSIKLFRRHGFENTRVDDIVQALEISQPTFFRYFPSKDAAVGTRQDLNEILAMGATGKVRSEVASQPLE